MDIGFTGSKWGMSEAQVSVVSYITEKLNTVKARHGMCVGSDAQFHAILRGLRTSVWITGHPPIKQGDYFAKGLDCDEILEPKDYLVRNRDIVKGSEILIATPNTSSEVLRSGTWYTIRQAKKTIDSKKGKCKKVYIIKPDGKVDFYA